jgi:Tfp pilus assembly protein PilF
VNRTADAQSLLDAELKKNGKDTDALVQRSEIYLRDGKYSEATRDLEQALHNDPSAQAHYLMSKVHRESGAIMLQKQELSEALRLDPDLLRARIELANVLLLSNNPRAALEMLDAAPERQKGRMGYVLARNWALIANGDPGGRQGVEQTLGVARQPEALLQDAVLKLRARNLPGARAALEEVLKTDPEDMRALSTLVQTYMAQKQPEAALERIRRSVGLRPDSTKLQIFLGTWLLENGREAEGRQVLTAVKAAAPKNVASDLLLAGWDITTHNLDAARQRLTTLIVTNPGNIDAHMMLGNIEDMSEHHAGAVEHYRKVLELDSGNLRAMNNLAYNLAHDPATVDDALKYAQKAKELAPQSPQIQDTLGWVYYRKGLYAMAAKELEAVHAKEPTPLVKYHLGLVYMRLGRSNEGGRLVAAALVADPTLADKEDVQ